MFEIPLKQDCQGDFVKATECPNKLISNYLTEKGLSRIIERGRVGLKNSNRCLPDLTKQKKVV